MHASDNHIPTPTLNEPQADFLSLDNKFRGFVAGFGSGKTFVGCGGIMQHFWEYPLINAGYFAPSFTHIRDIFYPTVEEVAEDWGLKTKVHKSDKEVFVYEGKMLRGIIKCRSMDDPASIVGFKIGHALVDEIDILSEDKARAAWRKIIARMRYKKDGLRNRVDVTTTPEGFKFTYNEFVKKPQSNEKLRELYGYVQASTYDNEENLPDDYIDSLYHSYPPQLISAYLNGQFVNLTAGAVYPDFDRSANGSSEVVRAGEPLHIGMDFNVNNMAAVVYVMRDRLPHAVDELMGVRDTPAMVALIKERFAGHAITVYPDAAGQATSSKDSSISDHIILRNAGFAIAVSGTNPAIKDRINAMNAMILNGSGDRRLRVNVDKCPRFTESLEQQAYDKHGQPDKSGGLDHAADAGGYAIAKLFPIAIPKIQTSAIIPPRVNHWGNR